MKVSTQKLNSNYRHRSFLSQKGFTLIEVIVVMAIIAGLAAIGFGVFMKMNETAKENETRVILEAVASAMEARSADISSDQREDLGLPDGALYPEGDGGEGSSEDLIYYISGDFNGDGSVDEGAKTKLPEVVEQSAGKNSYIKEVDGSWKIVDSWGTPIQYTYQENNGEFYGDYHTEINGFDLESAGPDKAFGTEDDLILK